MSTLRSWPITIAAAATVSGRHVRFTRPIEPPRRSHLRWARHPPASRWNRAAADGGRRRCRPSACRACAPSAPPPVEVQHAVNIALYSTASKRSACRSIISLK